MSNMSYCRFENTLRDLQDCNGNFYRPLNIDEAHAAFDLYQLCKEIVYSYDSDRLKNNITTFEENEIEDDED